jgi:hypothetical protein
MTSISLPGVVGAEVADWGRKSVVEMLSLIRAKARLDKAVAEAILAAPDRAFCVETYLGVHVRRSRVTLQQGSER